MKKAFLKKTIVSLLICSMILPFAGCGQGNKEPEKTKMSEEDKNSIYKYENMNWDEESLQKWGYLQFMGDAIYTTLYEYDEETYESTKYFVQLDMNGNELKRILIPEGWDEETGASYGMNNLCVADDGSIYGVDYLYNNYYDESTGEYVWDEAYSLTKLDEEGNKVWTVPLGGQGSDTMKADGSYEGEYYYVHQLKPGADGNLWVFDSKAITAFDSEGNVVKSMKTATNPTGVYPTKDGNFVIGSWGTDYMTLQYYKVDTVKGVVEEEPLETPSISYQYSFYAGIDGEYDIYATNSIGVWAFNWGDTEMVKVMDYILSDFESTYIENIKPISDTQFIGMYYDFDWNMQIATFTKVPAEEVVDKYIINMACHYLSDDIRKQVIDFNRSHDEVRIKVEDYSMYANEENYEAGIEKLNEDILAGKVPDILIAPSNMDLGMYANKGLFTDLYELMDNDETIQREDYLENILALGEYNGELYELIPKFNVVTLVGKTSDVGEGYSWTYDDVNALLSTKGDEVSLFAEDTVRSTVLNYGINLAFGQFYDSNMGECKFNSPEFIQFLELLNEFPEELTDDPWMGDNYWMEYEAQWREGRSILRHNYLYDFRNYVENAQGYFGEDISYIGFPTAEGECGSCATVEFTLAIAEESAFKDEAWEFVSYFIKDEYQEECINGGFPVKLSALDTKAEKEMEPNTWTDEMTGEVIVEDYYFWIGEEELILELPTEEECQYVIDFLKSITYRRRYNDDIIAIIEEEIAAYFAGEKSAEAVADIIQSRVDIYISEKR